MAPTCRAAVGSVRLGRAGGLTTLVFDLELFPRRGLLQFGQCIQIIRLVHFAALLVLVRVLLPRSDARLVDSTSDQVKRKGRTEDRQQDEVERRAEAAQAEYAALDFVVRDVHA